MTKSPVKYDWFFSNNVSDVVKAGQTMQIGLKERDKIIESGITWKNGDKWRQIDDNHVLGIWALYQIFVTIVFDFVWKLYIYILMWM